MTTAGQAAQRVETDRRPDFPDFLFVRYGQKRPQHVRIVDASVQRDGDLSEIDVLEQALHLDLALLAFLAEIECQRRHTAFDGFHRLGIGFALAFHIEFLADLPRIALHLATADKGEVAGHHMQVLQIFQIRAAVVRTDIESLAGTPYKPFFIVSPFQVARDDFFPLRRRDWRKFGKKFLFRHNELIFLFQDFPLGGAKLYFFCGRQNPCRHVFPHHSVFFQKKRKRHVRLLRIDIRQNHDLTVCRHRVQRTHPLDDAAFYIRQRHISGYFQHQLLQTVLTDPRYGGSLRPEHRT